MFACIWMTGWRDEVAEPQRVLLEVAQRFSPRAAWVGRDALVLDVAGLRRLFGEPRELGAELRRALADAGLETRIALAGTRTAARLLVHARAGLTVTEPGDEAAALAQLPIALLQHVLVPPQEAGRPSLFGTGAVSSPPSRFYRSSPVQEIVRPRRRSPGVRRPAERAAAEWLATFRRWGLRTLGDLATLPPGELAARLGDAGPALQRLARGEDPEPLVPMAGDERFEETLSLDWPIEGLEPLSFVLARLCDPLCAQLDRRGRAAAVLHVELRLVTRERWTRRLDLPAPVNDPRTLRTLALLDLESSPPPAAIDAVTVRVDPTPARTLQFSLLERARPAPEQVATLTARLRALMGERRVGRPVLLDTHRPDAWRIEPFTGEDGQPVAPGSTPSSVRPSGAALRRLRPPIPARVVVDAGRPTAVRVSGSDPIGGTVQQAAGPWRASGDWWTPGEAWDRDEWDVALDGGTVCRLVRDRRRDCWYLDGLYD